MGAGMVWELTRRSELLRCKNLSMKSRMPNHSSGKFCNCDREGRCCRNEYLGRERGKVMLVHLDCCTGVSL